MSKLFKRLLSLTIIAVMVFAMIPAVSAVEMNGTKSYSHASTGSTYYLADSNTVGEYTFVGQAPNTGTRHHNSNYIFGANFDANVNRWMAFQFNVSEEVAAGSNHKIKVLFQQTKALDIYVYPAAVYSAAYAADNMASLFDTESDYYLGQFAGTDGLSAADKNLFVDYDFSKAGDYVIVIKSATTGGSNQMRLAAGGFIQLRYHAHTFGAETVIKDASIFNGTITSKTCTDETCGETVITEADDKDSAPEGAVVCMDATNYYTSFADLAEANAVSGVYGLVSDDYSETLCYVPAGVTLDLMGNNLTAKAIIAEGEIRDSIGGGKLVADSVVLKGQDGYIPVNNGSGYVFYAADLTQTQLDGDVYTFLPAFDTDLEAALADGATALGLKIAVRVSYTTASGLNSYTDFVYSDDLVKQVYDGTGANAFSLTISNASSYTNIAYSVMIVSDLAMATITG